MDLPDELAALQRFHGHLGVYVTVGLRMGAIGKRRFGHYKGLRAIVRSQSEPPMRCVLDGVQFSSGCTMGKGNIALESGSEPAVVFEKDGRRIQIALRPGWRERIDREMSKDKELEQSLYYYELPERDLLEIREGSRSPACDRPVHRDGHLDPIARAADDRVPRNQWAKVVRSRGIDPHDRRRPRRGDQVPDRHARSEAGEGHEVPTYAQVNSTRLLDDAQCGQGVRRRPVHPEA